MQRKQQGGMPPSVLGVCVISTVEHESCAGKTHTMQGPADDPGVYQRALQELFSATAGNGVSQGADISVAMLEIYNEDVRDLLASDSSKALDVCGLGPGQLPPGVVPAPHAHSSRQLRCDVRGV